MYANFEYSLCLCNFVTMSVFKVEIKFWNGWLKQMYSSHYSFMAQSNVILCFVLDGLFEISDFIHIYYQTKSRRQRSGCTRYASFQQFWIKLCDTHS